jgi:rare lipoprotein A
MKICKIIASILVLICAQAAGIEGSWYGEEHRGMLMANGRPFNPDNLTAASWFYPLGSKIRVSLGTNHVDVTITDRGPNKRLVSKGRLIDLSKAAFARLADPDLGIIDVNLKLLANNPPGK